MVAQRYLLCTSAFVWISCLLALEAKAGSDEFTEYPETTPRPPETSPREPDLKTNPSAPSSDDFNIEESIQDLLENPLYGDEADFDGRFFNFDRGAAFNTSVAFTIPLFSFTLPGAQETAETGLDSNSFGVLAFVALFLLGGLGVAIYTTSQGGNADGLELPRGISDSWGSSTNFIHRFYDSISGLPEALDWRTCAKLSVCSAHAEPGHYGPLSWPIRFLVPTRLEEESQAGGVWTSPFSDFEMAALLGAKGALGGKEDDCEYEYPCLIHPLDAIIRIKDYLLQT